MVDMRQERRIPSNRMPAFVLRRTGLTGWVVLTGLGAGAVWLCLTRPLFASVAILIIAAVSRVLSAIESHRRLRIATRRQAESICSFARSFDCRATDTWIIRAVFEELAAYVRFPVRPDDRLQDDLMIDSEELADIAEAVAQRSGRPLEECGANPLYGKVRTVRELVEFFVHQPRRSRPTA
jgi:hypothetical protein